ncbi:MAG TPA: TrkH family potassium uptake protein [Candidatus Methanomethylophilaceae archaeon]|nr:TrkH family potassium uptake protein [Candidatus Methanomethylophilaceae archaeon]
MAFIEVPKWGGGWKNTVLYSLGYILLLLGVALTVPLVLSFYYGDNPLMFLIPMAVTLTLGLFISFMFREGEDVLQATSGILLIGGAFLIMFLVCSIPYIIFGMPVLDSIFESMSGVTTTGFSMVSDFDSFPQSLFLWRSLTQWIGGVSVLLVFLYMLPIMGLGGKGFFINEMSGSGGKNFSNRLKDSVKSFLFIYVLLTIILFIVLIFLNTSALDSGCMTLSTVSTGGFMNNAHSLSDYSSAVRAVVVLFMFLGGTNFYLHFKGIYKGNIVSYVKNTEFRWTLYWFIGIALLITGLLVNASGAMGVNEVLKTLGDSLFTVISIGTTTGHTVLDYSDLAVWSVPLCATLLMIVAFVGGMSGSTASGVKMYRLVIIGKYIKNTIYKTLHPMAVYDVKVDGSSVEESSVINAFVTLTLFVLTLGIASVILMVAGMSPEDSLGLAISSASNSGAALGSLGPYAALYTLDPLVKVVMMVVMFLGRLEIATALLFFMPGFWREVGRNRGGRSRRLRRKKDFNIKRRLDKN